MSESSEESLFFCASDPDPVVKLKNQIRPSTFSRIPPSPFYFEDSQVVLQASRVIIPLSPLNIVTCFYIQVENQKYKIHRYFLVRESEFFKDLFNLPQPEGTTGVEGSDDEHPLVLPETTIVELENLLRFFYFGYGSVPVDISLTDHRC
jgi:BTB/POZ domain